MTAETFKGLDQNLSFRQKMAVRAALGGNRTGLLPNAPFNCDATFVNNALEIEQLKCLAVLPSGATINPDEKVEVKIPMLYGDEYFLTVGIGENYIEFEKNGVPYTRPQYTYKISTPDETENEDVMPLMKFYVNQGTLTIDEKYITPCLLFASNPKLEGYREEYAEMLNNLATHNNMEEGDAKRALLHYTFLIKGFNKNASTHDFIQFTQEIAQAIDYYVMTPHAEEKPEIPQPTQADCAKWLEWLKQYLQAAQNVMDKVVLEDNTIDYEALLKQAKEELHTQLHPELLEELLKKIKEEILQEIEEFKNSINAYVKDEVKPELADNISNTLNDKTNEMKGNFDNKFLTLSGNLEGLLFEEVYEQLYNDLYDALYMADDESNDFIPLI